MDYAAIVAARRALRLPGFVTYAEAGLEGEWVTPYHIAACAPDGPVLLTYNYLDAPTARLHADTLRRDGYLGHMPFNRVLDAALVQLRLERADLYVTHAFHMLVPTRSAVVPMAALRRSFDAVARHELAGRRIIALGTAAGRLCHEFGLPHRATAHPSARGLPFAVRAEHLARAIEAVARD